MIKHSVFGGAQAKLRKCGSRLAIFQPGEAFWNVKTVLNIYSICIFYQNVNTMRRGVLSLSTALDVIPWTEPEAQRVVNKHLTGEWRNELQSPHPLIPGLLLSRFFTSISDKEGVRSGDFIWKEKLVSLFLFLFIIFPETVSHCVALTGLELSM